MGIIPLLSLINIGGTCCIYQYRRIYAHVNRMNGFIILLSTVTFHLMNLDTANTARLFEQYSIHGHSRIWHKFLDVEDTLLQLHTLLRDVLTTFSLNGCT